MPGLVTNGLTKSLLIALGVAAVLGWSAYRYGMFFENDFYRLEAFLYIGLIVWIVFHSVNRRVGAIPLWALLPFGMFAVYALELSLGPASVKGTIDAMLRWLAYSSWTLLLWGLWRKPESRVWGLAAIQSAGLLLLAGGWAGWYGWTSFTEIVLKFNDAELSATGARLAGFMQYPNAYGAVMAAFLLMQLQAWTSSGKHKGYSWLAAATVIPYGGAILLTESRGAVVALALGLFLAFLLADRPGRRKLLLISGITAIGSALMAKAAWNWMEAVNEFEGVVKYQTWASGQFWISVASALAGTIVLIGLIIYQNRKASGNGLNSIENRAWLAVSWIVAGSGMAVAAWAAFGSAGARIAGHYGTVASRKLFYADAWEMFKHSPWLGYGGESWRMLFGLYQSQPYVGNEVHSGYIEIALDTGLVGLSLLLIMIIVYLSKIGKHRKAAVAPAAVLLIHAAVDFDWSYGFVWLLLLAWFMLHIAPSEERAAILSGAWRPIGRLGLALLLVGSAMIALWAAWRSDAAQSARAAAASAATPAAREAQLRAALEANPAWSRIRLELAPLLPLQEQASLLEAGLRYEPQAPPLLLKLGIAYAELGDVAQARSRLREALRLERFSREGQTAAIAAMASLAKARQEGGDAEQAREAAEATMSMFEQYRALDRQVTAMRNPANGKKFRLTIASKLHAAQCLILLSRTDEAGILLREVIDEGDEDWQEQARELLNSLPNL
ncbi:O-antigen ligase family protein [Cohnella silvisoli]|uniref:O-antigen ligase family protein n=1 Tax=Cohnella silvisoli TaxID=2873699 RepID=A0ABV1L3R9_9BACL|nr:O-antigen ligase family protein [Cohnella silvisoli]MCD9026002.1 O-antigen ligase family protein [Cohnella silvisoli]